MDNTSGHPTTMPLISTHAGREIWSDKPFYLDARDPTQLFIVICIELEANKKRFLETKTIHALFTTLAAEVAASATHSTQDACEEIAATKELILSTHGFVMIK